MATVKEEILDWAHNLPNDCSWDDLRYFLYVREQVELGLKDIEEGRVIPQAEAVRRMADWRKSAGRKSP